MRPKLVPELDVADLPRALHSYVDICGFSIDYERRRASPTSSAKGRS